MIMLSALLIAIAYRVTYSNPKLRLIFQFSFTYLPFFFFLVVRLFVVCSLINPFFSRLTVSSTAFIMGKSKVKATKSPKKPRAETSQTGGKRNGRARKTVATMASDVQSEGSDNEVEQPTFDALTVKIPARVVWDKYPERTERLLDYLDVHPDVAIRLFGDSTQAAKTEGRSKLTAKSNKNAAYLQVAEGIFSIDESSAVRADFKNNPSKYAKAVDNYITNT
jgi:hypothetical protein